MFSTFLNPIPRAASSMSRYNVGESVIYADSLTEPYKPVRLVKATVINPHSLEFVPGQTLVCFVGTTKPVLVNTEQLFPDTPKMQARLTVAKVQAANYAETLDMLAHMRFELLKELGASETEGSYFRPSEH